MARLALHITAHRSTGDNRRNASSFMRLSSSGVVIIIFFFTAHIHGLKLNLFYLMHENFRLFIESQNKTSPPINTYAHVIFRGKKGG